MRPIGGWLKARRGVLGPRLVVYLQLAALLPSVAIGRCGESWLGGLMPPLVPAVAWYGRGPSGRTRGPDRSHRIRDRVAHRDPDRARLVLRGYLLHGHRRHVHRDRVDLLLLGRAVRPRPTLRSFPSWDPPFLFLTLQ